MIGYIRGTVSHLVAEYCLIDVHGIGYRVFIPASTREKLVIGKEIILKTYLNVREDALQLYGFYTDDEYELFIHLTGVSGIGPKVAVAILSAMQPKTFQTAIFNKDIKLLTQIPGIGKKTAERLILELKDKIKCANEILKEDKEVYAQNYKSGVEAEALQALVSLGYSQSEVIDVIKKITKQEDNVEVVIKQALKEIARR